MCPHQTHTFFIFLNVAEEAHILCDLQNLHIVPECAQDLSNTIIRPKFVPTNHSFSFFFQNVAEEAHILRDLQNLHIDPECAQDIYQVLDRGRQRIKSGVCERDLAVCVSFVMFVGLFCHMCRSLFSSHKI